jgi:hypothetical protein
MTLPMGHRSSQRNTDMAMAMAVAAMLVCNACLPGLGWGMSNPSVRLCW